MLLTEAPPEKQESFIITTWLALPARRDRSDSSSWSKYICTSCATRPSLHFLPPPVFGRCEPWPE